MAENWLDRTLNESLAAARKSDALEFDAVIEAAARRACRSAQRRRMGLGLSGVAAALAIMLLFRAGPDADEQLDFSIDASLMTNTLWPAPSDRLMPDHLIDIYEPLSTVSTNVLEGTLL